jgi:hypothetical protein
MFVSEIIKYVNIFSSLLLYPFYFYLKVTQSVYLYLGRYVRLYVFFFIIL